MGTHTQDDERARIEISQGTVDMTGDHPVESADCAQRAMDELGGEGSIAIGEVTVAPGLTQSLRQNDVRERALGLDLVENVVGNTTGLIGLAQLAVTVRVTPLAHRSPSNSPPRRRSSEGRAPLAQAAASIQDLPAGATFPSTRAPLAQPTVTCFFVTSSCPGSRS